MWQVLRPHMINRGNVNAVDRADAQYARLARVKATYDPDNVFHRNVNMSSGGIPVPRS